MEHLMSKKQNRVRARRARQQQELLSLRAELLLLYDGAPMPNHYLELDRLQTRELVRAKRFYMDNTAEKLRHDIARQLITELREAMKDLT
jgi:hypothetical protein